MSAPGTPSPFQIIFKHLGDQLVQNVEGGAVGLLSAFFNNIKANPDTQNIMAQGAILAASAPLQLPNLEKSAVSEIADAGLALLAQSQVVQKST